ncbi:MAG: oligosaccharide flippase family protein [Gemmatimonadaceae bacterium]
MRRLWFQIAHTSGATIVSIAASIISMTITARLLGPTGRGVFVAATSWVGLFATLGTLSLGQVVVHQVAGRPHEDWLEEITGTALAITVGVTLCGWLLVAVLYHATGGELFGHLPPMLLALAFLSLPLALWADTARYVVTALDAIRVANWAQIVSAATAVIGIVMLVGVLRSGVRGAVIAAVLANVASAGVMLVYVLRRVGRMQPQLVLARRLLRGSAQLHLTAVGNYLYTQASVLVLNYYRPPAETGYYQLAAQLFGFALIVSTAVSTVSFGLVAKKGPNGAWPEQRLLIAQSMGFACIIGVSAYVLAPIAIRLVAGERFLPAVPLFRIILPALFGATFSTVTASQWIGRGLFVQAAVLTIIIGALSITLDLILVPRYGMRGAVVSTLVTYGISVVGNGTMALWVQRQWKKAQVVLA